MIVSPVTYETARGQWIPAVEDANGATIITGQATRERAEAAVIAERLAAIVIARAGGARP